MSNSVPLARGKYQSEKLVARQNRILSTARDLIARSGYEGLKMRALAEEAGVAKKTLYNQYSGKDDIVLAATMELLVGIRDKIKDTPGGVPMILERQKVTCDQVVNAPEYAKAMIRALSSVGEGHGLVEVLIVRGQKVLTEDLRLAIELDQVRSDIQVALMANTINSHTWGLLLLWSKGNIKTSQLQGQLRFMDVSLLANITKGQLQKSLQNELIVLGAGS